VSGRPGASISHRCIVSGGAKAGGCGEAKGLAVDSLPKKTDESQRLGWTMARRGLTARME